MNPSSVLSHNPVPWDTSFGTGRNLDGGGWRSQSEGLPHPRTGGFWYCPITSFPRSGGFGTARFRNHGTVARAIGVEVL